MIFKGETFKKIINKLRQIFIKKPEFFVLGFYAILIIFLSDNIKINPDEYLYASIGNNLANSIRTGACFSCIDTYHTFLLPLVISVFNLITGINSFFSYRLIISFFSIGSVYTLYLIFKEIFNDSKIFKDSFIFFLLLFPGFFYYSGLILLDNVATFFFLFLIYLIIKKSSYWKISIVFLFMFLSKEYYVFFGAFVIATSILFDAFVCNKNRDFIWKCEFVLKNFSISLIPSILMLLSIIFFPIFPYPNILEPTIIKVFGGLYVNVGEYVRKIMHGTQAIQQHVRLIANTIQKENFPLAIYIEDESSFWLSVLSYFKSIFKEVSVNLYVLPLVFSGIIIWINNFFVHKINVEKLRQGVLMSSILMVFIIFIIATGATGKHGFRIALIFMIPAIYFISPAIESLLIGKFDIKKSLFIILSFAYVAYQLVIDKNMSGSLLYEIEGIQVFIKYKFYFNLIFYALPIIIVITKLKIKTKKTILFLWILSAFIYKLGPTVFDSQLIKRKSAIDYNLSAAVSVLSDIEKKEPIIITNYERAYYFYSNSIKMPNNIRDRFPIIRFKPSLINIRRIFKAELDDADIIGREFLCKYGVDYVFYVNKNFESNDTNQKLASLNYLEREEEFFENGYFNWGLYRFDKNNCK